MTDMNLWTNDALEHQISWFYRSDPDNEGYIEIMWDQFDTRVKLGFITIE